MKWQIKLSSIDKILHDQLTTYLTAQLGTNEKDQKVAIICQQIYYIYVLIGM